MANPGMPEGIPGEPLQPGMPGQAPPPTQSSDGHEVSLAGLTEGIGHVFEAIHEAFASPEELAQDHMAKAHDLQMEGMQALMAGDVEGGSALIAQAGQEMQSAVGHLSDPDFKDPEKPADDGTGMGMNSGHGVEHLGDVG